MKLLHVQKDSWVAVRDEVARDKPLGVLVEELQQKIFRTELWLSDLDDTHAPSPGKHAALHALGTHYYNLRYWWWVIKSAGKFLGQEPGFETQCWKEYVHLFLRSAEALDEVRGEFTPERAAATLYPGVASLHTAVLSHARRFYITRNIREIVEPYAQTLGFEGMIVEAFDKERVVQQLIGRFPRVCRYGIEGDSPEDGKMVKALRNAAKDVLGLYVMKEPDVRRLDPHFDYAVSRSRVALVELLSSPSL